MFAFIDEAKRGVEYSHKAAVKAKTHALAVIDEQKAAFGAGRLDRKACDVAAKAMISAVKESIDPLEVTKDPLSYTFASSLTAAIDEYFGAVRREKDANDESDENADEKEAKAEIFRIIERIRHSFEIEISKQRDEEEKPWR